MNGMSAFGPKRTWAIALHMSAFGGKADMAFPGITLSRSLLGVKRTWAVAAHMSAYDPKRTLALAADQEATPVEQQPARGFFRLGADIKHRLPQVPGDAHMDTKSVASSAFTVVACIFCMGFVMRPTVVSGASMMPTLHDKILKVSDQIVSNKS